MQRKNTFHTAFNCKFFTKKRLFLRLLSEQCEIEINFKQNCALTNDERVTNDNISRYTLY